MEKGDTDDTGEPPKFIAHAVAILKQDRRIAGIALCGSYKTGQMDEYSDLDFLVAVEPYCFEQVLGEKMRLPSASASYYRLSRASTSACRTC
jgi:predicted nucleotidyltransferase